MIFIAILVCWCIPIAMLPTPTATSTSKRSATVIDNADNKKKRTSQLADLVSVRGVSKSGLVRVLEKIDANNLMIHKPFGNTTQSLMKAVQHATEDIGKQQTMYGRVVKSMQLPCQSLPTWDYICPMAFVHYACMVSLPFFTLMKAVIVANNNSLRLVIYIDGITPGNPLHPSPKELQCIYWGFVEWPRWFLSRKDSWPVFSVIRSSVCYDDITGGMGYILKLILRTFFAPTGTSFLQGVVLQHGGDSIQFSATFCGIIADEKSLKECFDLKGASGMFPCPSCINVCYKRQSTREWAGCVTVCCTDTSKFKPKTAAVVENMVKRLNDAPSKGGRELLEQRFGVKLNTNGLLCDTWLCCNVLAGGFRNYIRDGMHTCSSNGVAGTEIARTVQALTTVKVPLAAVQTFAKKWVLPRALGKVSDLVFQESLIDSDHVRHFASDVLVMVWLMHAFLSEKIAHRNMIPDHIKCFSLLYDIMTMLRRGGPSTTRLREKIVAHGVLFVRLFGNDAVKIKFHHLYHLPGDIEWMGTWLTCFVFERKHYDLKVTAKEIHKHIEHTVVNDILNQTVHGFLTQPKAFMHRYLIKPSDAVVGQLELLAATSAVFECGTLHQDDVVMLRDGSVARVVEFVQHTSDQSIVVRLIRYSKVSNTLWAVRFTVTTVDADLIVEAIPYYNVDGSHIRTVPEPSD